MSNASMSPGVTITLHSCGCKLSQDPRSDQEKIDATTLEALPACCGTVLYGACDADCDGDREAFCPENKDSGGEVRFGCCLGGGPRCIGFSSPRTSKPSSPEDSDVIDSSSLRSEASLSDDDSVAVEGSYSCFSGDEERRVFFMNAGVNDGKLLLRRGREASTLCEGG